MPRAGSYKCPLIIKLMLFKIIISKVNKSLNISKAQKDQTTLFHACTFPWMTIKYKCSYLTLKSFLLTVFNQGEDGKSWYIIMKGSVNVVIFGKVRIPVIIFYFSSFILFYFYFQIQGALKAACSWHSLHLSCCLGTPFLHQSYLFNTASFPTYPYIIKFFFSIKFELFN